MKPPRHPWRDLHPSGAGLSVDDFLTTKVVRLGDALRRRLTQTYVASVGVTQTQWRILSVLAEHPQMQMNELVTEAAVDKSLVSRVLRQLETLSLVELKGVPNAPRKGLACKLSPKGLRLYQQTIATARQTQAEMLMRLTAHEREVMYRAIGKLSAACQAGEPAQDEAPEGDAD